MGNASFSDGTKEDILVSDASVSSDGTTLPRSHPDCATKVDSTSSSKSMPMQYQLLIKVIFSPFGQVIDVN